MKPISTTLTPLMSVDLATGESAPTRYERSDFSAVSRAVVIGEAMAAWVIADALMEKLGGDSLAEQLPRFAGLARSRLSGRADGQRDLAVRVRSVSGCATDFNVRKAKRRGRIGAIPLVER